MSIYNIRKECIMWVCSYDINKQNNFKICPIFYAYILSCTHVRISYSFCFFSPLLRVFNLLTINTYYYMVSLRHTYILYDISTLFSLSYTFSSLNIYLFQYNFFHMHLLFLQIVNYIMIRLGY